MAESPQIRFELETIESQLTNLYAAARRERTALPALLEDGQEWRPLSSGDPWAGPDEVRRIGIPFHVPEAWRGKIALDLELAPPHSRSWPEALVYLDGRAIQGVDRFHREVLLDGLVRPGQHSEFLVEAYSGKPAFHQTLGSVELVLIDPEAEALYHDLRVLVGVIRELPPDSVVRVRVLRAMERA